jgi:GAF domain
MHFLSQTDGSDPSAALESISQHARVLTRGTGAAIALAHKGSMICRASVGNAPTLGARLDVSSGLSGECVRTGRVIRCDNSDNDPRVDAESCRRLGIHSILAAPIWLGGEVVGILEVFSSQRFNFHDGDLAVVEHLAQNVFAVPPSAKSKLTGTTTPTVKTEPAVETAPATVKTVPPVTTAPPTLKTAPPVTTAPPTFRTAPPVTTAPPTLKTAPPVTTAPPTLKTAPPVTTAPPTFRTAPPVTTAPPTLKTAPPVTTAPPTFKTAPPVTTAPPTFRTAPPVTTAPPTLKTAPSATATSAVKTAPAVKVAPLLKTIPPPKLLLELEPAWQVFFGNLVDLLFPPRTVPLKLTSRPAAFWTDVFVPSRLPWDQFVQSMSLHVIMLAVLGLVDLALLQRPQLKPGRLPFNKSDVIYYLPPEYMQSLRKESELSPSRIRRSAVVRPPFLSVHRESVNRAQKSIPPPILHLKQGSRFRMMAWNPTAPVVPFSATTRSQRNAPAPSIAAVAPPPDISAASRAQQLTLATPKVVQPAPSVQESARQRDGISLGHVEVVRPAPEIPNEQRYLSGAAQATLGKRATSVVPPAPSVHPSIHQAENISLGRLEVVRPAPEVPNEQRYLSGAAQATLGKGATSVVPPAPSVHPSIHQAENISLGRLEVVRPAPEVSNEQLNLSSATRATLGKGTTSVVPPAPSVHPSIHQAENISLGRLEVVRPAPEIPNEQRDLSGSAQAALERAAIPVVPPAPSVGGLGNHGQRTSARPGADTQVVPPPPGLLQIAGSYFIDTPDGGAILVVPPAPSIGGLEHPGGQSVRSLPGGMRAVPPAPQLEGAGGSGRGTGDGMAVAIVPPAPSVGSLGQSGSRNLSSQRAAGMQMAPPKVGVQAGGDSSKSARAGGLPGGLLPGELVGNGGEARVDPKDSSDTNEDSNAEQLNVNFIGPALVAPRSSYFQSFEVFIAEERLGKQQSRLIKLVYDFLPYQPRLSDYGPNYPALENLRATRDPSCDEPLKEVVSSANTLHWSQAARVQLTTTSSKQRQNTLPCYRTTADDYRRARDRQHR